MPAGFKLEPNVKTCLRCGDALKSIGMEGGINGSEMAVIEDWECERCSLRFFLANGILKGYVDGEVDDDNLRRIPNGCLLVFDGEP
jgi:DNA-directed RNA polymerase subunit RPC12/RpoP